MYMYLCRCVDCIVSRPAGLRAAADWASCYLCRGVYLRPSRDLGVPKRHGAPTNQGPSIGIEYLIWSIWHRVYDIAYMGYLVGGRWEFPKHPGRLLWTPANRALVTNTPTTRSPQFTETATSQQAVANYNRTTRSMSCWPTRHIDRRSFPSTSGCW